MAENRFWEITHFYIVKKWDPVLAERTKFEPKEIFFIVNLSTKKLLIIAKFENCISKNKAMSMNRIISDPKILALLVQFPGPEPHMANIHKST